MTRLWLLLWTGVAAFAEWPQWGGPNRDFHLDGQDLNWPAEGPRQLWKRELGDGYSSIVTAGKLAYTLFKRGTDTVVIALDSDTGKTIWERAFDAKPVKEKDEMNPVQGTTPASTPLIVGDRLFAITYLGRLVALDRNSGELLWSEELWRKHGGSVVEYGYTNSPLAYKDTIILPVGGTDRALMAFRQKDGAVVWHKGDSTNAMSSPILIEVDGQAQIAMVMLKEVIGMNPDTGELLWRFPHANKTDTNVSPPLWCPGNLLLVSSAYDSGTRALHLKRAGETTTVREAWFNPRVRVHHSNLLQIGELIYASSGDFGPAPVTAFRLATGEVMWQDRALAKANFVRIGRNVLALDEQGKLAVVTLGPAGIQVLGQADELVKPAWTPPSMDGSRVFIRDRHTVMALELSPR